MYCNDDIAIEVVNITKKYNVYSNPKDRLKQAIYTKLQKTLGKKEKKYFQEFSALKNVSFSIKKGETVGIVGSNGSGKSSILQIICGTLSPSEGSITTKGRVAALLELGSGFNPDFTGRENVFMNAAILGLSRSEIKKKYQDIENFADIGDFIDQPVKSYSSGMVVRLAFAVSINVEPEVLIIDEALSVGDERFQRKCFSRIEELKKKGTTILFVSHSGPQVVELCDRAILLDHGEKLIEGGAKEIVAQYQRLLYSNHEERNKIRNEIRSGVINEGTDGCNQWKLDFSRKKLAKIDEYYDPYLKSESKVSYPSNGVIISDFEIYNDSGERVNNLVKGRFYKYSYNVLFNISASYVRFGMLIKTVSGIELGGAISANSMIHGLELVKKNSSKKVTYSFQCNLNSGVYFLNAGVLGFVGDEETYLHRVIDAAMFRVLPEENQTATGFVEFHCTSDISDGV